MSVAVHTALPLARTAGEHLVARGFEHGRLEAELLLARVLGVKRLDLYLQHDRPVTEAELETFRACVRRRLRHEPVQYITGEAAFRRMVLKSDPRALIPRPETEVLAGEVLAWARDRTGLSALDVGTGTGAVALALALEGGFERVVATDVSAEALSLARENVEQLGAGDRVELREGSLLEPVHPGERFAVVVSNPPYVAESERETLAPEVREHEPERALFGGTDGYAVLLPLIEEAPAVLEAGGLLALEVAPGQAEHVAEAVRRRAAYGEPHIVKDLSARPRVVLAERSGNR